MQATENASNGKYKQWKMQVMENASKENTSNGKCKQGKCKQGKCK